MRDDAQAHEHRWRACSDGTLTRRTQPVLADLKKLDRLLTRRHRWDIAALLAMMIVSALLELVGISAIPAFVGMLVYPDRFADVPYLPEFVRQLGLGQDRQALVIWGVVVLIAVFAIKNAFLAFQCYWQVRFIHNRRASISRNIVNAYLHAPYAFFLRRNSSELIRNASMEAAVIATQVIGPLLEIVTRGLILIAVLGLLLVVEPLITLAWFAIFGVAAALGIGTLNASARRYGLLEQKHRQAALQALGQAFAGIKAIRILHRERHFAATIDHSIGKLSIALRYKQFVGMLMKPITEFIGIIGVIAIAAALVLLGRAPESIMVTLALFVVALVRFREALSAVATQYTVLRYSIVAVPPVHDDLLALEQHRAILQRERQQPRPPLHLTRAIELCGVSYRYDGAERDALMDIDLTIPAGSSVGLVGGTGAGKSTLVDILLGLLQPSTGSMQVDGTDVHRGQISAWQRSVGYVPQSIYLTDDTLRNNIALGIEPDAIDEIALMRAVRAAQLDDTIANLSHGLDTKVGEHGVRLSGGERQRVGIARALYHDPDVLVLDEATSSLDNSTERALLRALDALKGTRTTITIAHRLSTVRTCDRLYLLEAGRIAAAGPYDTLIEQSPEFRTLASA